jgi:hypothetical protein
MQTNGETSGVTFDGTLVRRQYRPGQKYIQLVFKTAGDTKLSLSRNARLAKSLEIGQKYRVHGEEYQVGDRLYIHEPTATPLPYTSKGSRKLRYAGFGLVALALAGGATFASGGFHQSSVKFSPAAQHSSTPALTSDTTAQTTPVTTVLTNPTSTTTPVAAAPKPKTVNSVSNSTPAPSVPVAPASGQTNNQTINDGSTGSGGGGSTTGSGSGTSENPSQGQSGQSGGEDGGLPPPKPIDDSSGSGSGSGSDSGSGNN